MDKVLDYPGKTEKGVHTFLIGEEQSYLVKTASEYHPTIASYVRNAKKLPGETQLLITALGAGEWWGDNTNSDFFGESELAHDGEDYGFKTFQLNARLYKHHVNKPNSQHYGRVILSVYNPIYHRVELIIAVDHTLAPDIISNIENNIYPVYSMGCKIPYDICSICGNKAPNRKFYCDHLKYQLGTIDRGTGRKVYAINIKPKFFDISIVIVPADKTAMTLKKVAFVQPKILDASGRTISSAEKAEKMAAIAKISTIEKEITSAPPASEDIIDTDNLVKDEAVRTAIQGVLETKSLEKRFPNHVIDRMCEVASMPEILSTMLSCAIMPKPQEFQRIFLISRGARTFADKLDRANACFDPRMSNSTSNHSRLERELDISENNVRSDLAEILQPYFNDRSCTPPLLVKRMTIMVKEGYDKSLPPTYVSPATRPEDEHSMLKTLAIGAALYGVLNQLGNKNPSLLKQLISEHPLIATALGIGVYGALYNPSNSKMPEFRGRFSDTTSVIHDSSNTYDRINEMRERPYIKVGNEIPGLVSGPVLRRLLIGLPAVHLAAGSLQRHKEMHPGEEQGMVSKFITDHPNLAKGIVVADALLASKGKGSYVITRPLVDAQTKWLRGEPMFKAAGIVDTEETYPEAKSASAVDYVTSSLVWPLVTGTANLPGRIVGSLFDQAALDVGGKLVEKYKQRKQDTAQTVKGVSYANPSGNS